jgi:hypothetical protein
MEAATPQHWTADHPPAGITTEPRMLINPDDVKRHLIADR